MRRFVRDERGETLVELMITIMVISIGMVTLIGALGTSIILSDAHRGMSVGEVVVRDYAEAIKVRAMQNRDASGTSYVPCPDKPQLDPKFDPGGAFTPPQGWLQPTITLVEWWIPSSTPNDPGTWTAVRGTSSDPPGDSSCYAYFNKFNCTTANAASCDAGLQRVTFEVKNDREGAAATALTAQVIVRRANDSGSA